MSVCDVLGKYLLSMGVGCVRYRVWPGFGQIYVDMHVSRLLIQYRK